MENQNIEVPRLKAVASGIKREHTPPLMPEKRDKWGFNDYLMVWLALVACSCIFFAIGDSVGYQLHESHFQSLRTAENARKDLEIKVCESSLSGEKKNTDKIILCAGQINYWEFKKCVNK